MPPMSIGGREHRLGAAEVRSHDDLIVDVRHVHYESYVVAEVVRHDSADDVEVDVVPRVAHVRAVVHRRAADVPSHAVAVERDEGNLGLGERVEQARGVSAGSIFGSLGRLRRGPPRDGRAAAAEWAVLWERLFARGHRHVQSRRSCVQCAAAGVRRDPPKPWKLRNFSCSGGPHSATEKHIITTTRAL